jgi:aspartyl/asparaginyl beta-hydroxylase (cupin superfamily)
MIAGLTEKLIARTPGGNGTFFDTADYPWVARVEEEWKAIRAELDTLLLEREKIPNFQDLSKYQSALTTGDQWKTYFLWARGNKNEANCARCPETTRILRKIPGLRLAMFSILAPHKHIPGHRGPYKGVLRYHLGLLIPDREKCRILVGTDTRHWDEGKSLVFDDSHWHEAWNDTDYHRVVLFVDFVRPLPLPLAVMNRYTIWRLSKSL